MYSEVDTRYPQLIAISRALKEAIQKRLPVDLNGNRVTVQTYKDIIPVNNALDDPEITEYSTPSIVIMQPEWLPFPFLNSNRPIYRDFDYEKLEAKEFNEPEHGKLRFPIHTIASDPDNDLLLQTFMIRCRKTIGEVYASIYPDSEQYDRVVLYWREPTDYASEDTSRIRVYPVDALVHLEFLEFHKVKLVDPENPVEFTASTSIQGLGIPAYLSHAVSSTSSEVYVIGSTRILPVSGTGTFSDGSEFEYTGKTPYMLTGVSGIVGYHNSGEKIIVR